MSTLPADSHPNPPTVRFSRVRPHEDADLLLPSYQTDGAAGADIRAAVAEPICLEPMQRALVPTGFAMAIPVGWEAQVRPRSGLAIKHGVTLVNSPGTIDADYRGEVKVILINLGTELFEICRGDRIAQLVFAEAPQLPFEEVASLDETVRGAGGFGHTGV